MRGKLVKFERLDNSRNGNPNFLFTFEDGSTARTANDLGWAYTVGDAWVGGVFDVRLRRGRVVSMARADGAS